jgi:nitroreductase
VEFQQVLYQRKSYRWYLHKNVDPSVLEDILHDASQAPSFMNHQPWEVAIARGQTLQRIMELLDQKMRESGEVPQPFPWLKVWPGRHQVLVSQTREKTGKRELPEDDPLGKWNYNAPIALYFHLHRELNEWSLIDLGAFAQSLMLAAADRGLQSVPQAKTANFPEEIREILELGPERKIIMAVTLGYGDVDHPNNQNKSDRAPLVDWTQWYD